MAPTAQRSVGLSLRARKDRAASLQHAHARKSVGPSLRVRVGPRDGPKAHARNPGQDTECTLRSRFPRTAPQLWSSPTGLATQCNRSGPFLCSAGSELATVHAKCRVRQRTACSYAKADYTTATLPCAIDTKYKQELEPKHCWRNY